MKYTGQFFPIQYVLKKPALDLIMVFSENAVENTNY